MAGPRRALWLPVCLGAGIWLRFDGSVLAPAVVVAASVLLIIGALWLGGARVAGRVILFVLAVATGFAAASLRIAHVSAPVLAGPFEGVVEGRIIEAGRARSGAPRVTLDNVALSGVHPTVTPERVRITLVDLGEAPQTGARIAISARLAPPAGPAAPGAFDFSRRAFFRHLGAVGYARGSPDISGPQVRDMTPAIRVSRWRQDVSASLQGAIDGPAGAVAAALIVGDRSAIPEDVVQALRDSGLAHLLAISGLHMGLFGGLVFGAIRLGLAFSARLSEARSSARIAALAGLLATAGYLVASGAGIATQRAFLMAATVFVAILVDRPAVTMRALALAAGLILLLRPESLFEAGFQMSFAAVAALVAVYEATRPVWSGLREGTGWRPVVMVFVLGTLVTSVVAGMATAPFAAYHFNRMVLYGLPANLLATPLMGLWIMPAILLAGLLAPFGLDGVAFALLGAGIDTVIGIARVFGGIEGAVAMVRAGTPLALALIVSGGLWLVILRGAVRFCGGIGLLAGVVLWSLAPAPDLLVSRNAELVAGRDASGRLWLSRERAASFIAETWLRRDGQDPDEREVAWQRRDWRCDRDRCIGEITGVDGRPWRVVLGLRGPAQEECAPRTVLLPAEGHATDPVPGCIVLPRARLRALSSAGLFLDGETTDARVVPAVPWSPDWPRRGISSFASMRTTAPEP